VRDNGGPADGAPSAYSGGAALLAGDEGWVLLEDRPARGLGGALAWADRHGVGLQVLAERDSGLLARRAAAFQWPPGVWQIEGRELVPAVPAPRPTAPALPAGARELVPVIEAAGAEPVEEHGVLTGEVAGLEVCRVVPTDGPHGTDGPDDADGVRLDAGIGPHDREAFRLVHGEALSGAALIEALAEVVRTVGVHRRPGAPPHPLNRIARERALRHELLRRPELVELAELATAPPPVPRASVKDAEPCVARGRTAEGEDVVVVCSAGVDLDLVPFAADAREALGAATAPLLLALPAADVQPVTQRLAARLVHPATVIAVS
jgi:hypothetical protein